MKNIIIVIVVLVLVGGGIWAWQNLGQPEEEPIVKEPEEEFVFIDKVMIPVIDTEGAASFGDKVGWDPDIMREARETGEYIGCADRIVYIEKNIEPTPRPLEAIYRMLFMGDEIVEGTKYENPISAHIESLEFERVVIENNIARLYLSGNYISIGTCEPPRTEAVLEFAAKQYPWIEEVEIYIDNKRAEFIHGGKDE